MIYEYAWVSDGNREKPQMVRAKSKAKVMVADGAGGMTEVQDRRFETGDWPIRFEVPKEQADTWLRYFYAECGRRGWSSSGIGQFEAGENSGSITVNSGGPGSPQLAVVWERKRGGPIKVRARSAGMPEFSVTHAQELFDQTNDRCRSGATERFYRMGHLHFDRLAWRGELWLDDRLRLGPPSQQYEAALVGPRVIIVDALVDCAGDTPFVFDQALRELSAFLTVIMGTLVQLPEQRQKWTWTTGAADCMVRSLGYFESDNHQQMPARGVCHSVPPLALMEVPAEAVSSYGIVLAEPVRQVGDGLYRILDLVEKPKAGVAPSNLAVIGRYVLTPDVFTALDRITPGHGSEIQLTDALRILSKERGLYGLRFSGRRYDAGDKLGLLVANVEFALQRDDLGPRFLSYLRKLVEHPAQ